MCLDKQNIQRTIMQQIKDEYVRQLHKKIPSYTKPPFSFAERVEALEDESQLYAQLHLKLEIEMEKLSSIQRMS